MALCLGRWGQVGGDRFWPFSADHGYNACWSNPIQSLVRTNASDWSGRMQAGGHVERNFATEQTILSKKLKNRDYSRFFIGYAGAAMTLEEY
jgi:hypothetical protein